MSYYADAVHDMRVLVYRTVAAMEDYQLSHYLTGEAARGEEPIADLLWYPLMELPLPDGHTWADFFPRPHPLDLKGSWEDWVAAAEEFLADPDKESALPVVSDPDSAEWRDVFALGYGERVAELFRGWADFAGLCEGYNQVSAQLQKEFRCSPAIPYTELPTVDDRGLAVEAMQQDW